MIVKKLPFYLHDKWRNLVFELKTRKEHLTFNDLVSFVKREAKKANDPVFGKSVMSTSTRKDQKNKHQSKSKTKKAFATNFSEDNGSHNVVTCLYCGGLHTLYSCENITKLSLKNRYSFLKTKGLCYGCLKTGHLKSTCKNKLRCSFFYRFHASILHVDGLMKACDQNNNVKKELSSASHTGAGIPTYQALHIVPVRLKAKASDKFIETYAFLDTGSTATFCSDRVVKLLNVEGKRTKIDLVTMNQECTKDSYEIAGLEISSLDGRHFLNLPSMNTQRTLPVSRNDVPSVEDIRKWSHLKDIKLDRIDAEVDLLLGINVPKAMEPWDVIPSNNDGPFAMKTIFGWVINGPLESRVISLGRLLVLLSVPSA